MKEAYVSFEVAKLLKGKGLTIPSTNYEDWLCCMYDEDGNIHWGCYDSNWCPRITHQIARAWLLKEYYIYITIDCEYDVEPFIIYDYYFKVYSSKEGMYDDTNIYSTPEEAVEVALKYCLENLI